MVKHAAAARSSAAFNMPSLARLLLQDGVVLGADTRSTAGTTVADKNCEKIHYIGARACCCTFTT